MHATTALHSLLTHGRGRHSRRRSRCRAGLIVLIVRRYRLYGWASHWRFSVNAVLRWPCWRLRPWRIRVFISTIWRWPCQRVSLWHIRVFISTILTRPCRRVRPWHIRVFISTIWRWPFRHRTSMRGLIASMDTVRHGLIHVRMLLRVLTVERRSFTHVLYYLVHIRLMIGCTDR